MNKNIFLFSVVATLCVNYAFGQKGMVKDTLYYMVDTSKVPLNDRLVQIEQEGPRITYKITCPCLQFGEYPKFVTGNKRTEKIDRISKAPYTNLSNLLIYIKENSRDFNNKYVMYIVRLLGGSYVKQRAFLLVNQEPSIDQERIKQ